MKNTIKFLGIIALVAIIGFGLIGCDNGTTPTGGKTPLSTPSNVRVDDAGRTAFNLKWDAVEGADSYTLDIGGVLQQVSGSTTSYDLKALTEDPKVYPIKVRAVAYNGDADHSDSAYSTPLDVEPAEYVFTYEDDLSPSPSIQRSRSVARAAGDGGTSITGLTNYGNKLERIVIPPRIGNTEVTTIGDSAFADNEIMTSISLPETLTVIGNSAFAGTNITNITLPESVTIVGDGAFSNCIVLVVVVFVSPEPPAMGDNVFEGATAIEEIVVPEGSANVYEEMIEEKAPEIAEQVQIQEVEEDTILLTAIEVVQPPKTEYTAGEQFSANGMTVIARYSDNSAAVISNYKVLLRAQGSTSGTSGYEETDRALTVNDMFVRLSYTEDNITRIYDILITVTAGTTDPTSPSLVSVSANGNPASSTGGPAVATTQLTLTFREAVPGLSASNININPAFTKGQLTGPISGYSAPTYTLPITVENITGTVTATVMVTINGTSIGSQTVTIYGGGTSGGGDNIPVTFVNVASNGGTGTGTAGEVTTTTELYLTFSQPIDGLSADDITLSGNVLNGGDVNAIKGILSGPASGSAVVYTLPISGFTVSGSLFVSIQKDGYDISYNTSAGQQENALYVAVYYGGTSGGPSLVSVTANGNPAPSTGGPAVATTQLTLTFSEAVSGLSASNININPPFTKGQLTGPTGSAPIYTLPITVENITGTVTATVMVTINGTSIGSQTVTIYGGGTSGPDTGTEYKITVNAGTGGTITTNPYGQATAGATVMMMVSPNSGYTLDLSTFTVMNATTNTAINYQQSSDGGGYNFTMPESDVTISGSFSGGTSGGASLVSVTANGNPAPSTGGPAVATTELTLIFSEAVPDLSANNININPAFPKGQLTGPISGSAPTYTLPITVENITGTVTATVMVTIDGTSIGSQTVTIYGDGDPSGGDPSTDVSFKMVSANGNPAPSTGGPAVTTTELTLTFGGEISGLTVNDISLSMSGVSGIQKGTLSGPVTNSDNTSTYTLPISGFNQGGNLYVSVQKTGYTISPSSQTVEIYFAD